MAGLLDNKVGDVVKGVGMAALGGVNPLFGLLAAGGIKNNRMKREAENKKLRDQMTATDELTGLLNSKTTTAAPTVGPSKVVEGLPGMFEPFAIPGKRGEVPTVQTPEGQQQLLGIMSKLNPGATGASLLPKQNARTNTMQQRIGALGAEADRRGLVGEEKNAFIDQYLAQGAQGDPVMAMLMSERLEEKRLANDSAAEQARIDRENRERSRAAREVALNSTLRRVESLGNNNETLSENLWMRPGWAAKERAGALGAWEFGKRLVGANTKEDQDVLQAYTSFNKDAANLLADMLPNFEGMNAQTDSRLRQIQTMLADIGQEPGTNSKILAESIYEVLDIANINKFVIEDEQRWLNMAKQFTDFSNGFTSKWDIKPGTQKDGYEYINGDPYKRENWKKL